MNNKINWGLCSMYYAIVTETDGVITYGTPAPFPGAVNLVTAAKGDVVEFEADNIIYDRSNDNEGYDVTLETANIPDEFFRDVIGQAEDANKVLTETISDEVKRIALLGQFQGDVHNKRFVLYYCQPKRPNMDGQTERKKNPKTRQIQLSADPRPDGVVKASTKSDTATATYSGWFDAVYARPVAQQP